MQRDDVRRREIVWQRNSSWCLEPNDAHIPFLGNRRERSFIRYYQSSPSRRCEMQRLDRRVPMFINSSTVHKASIFFSLLKQLRILWRKFARLVTSRWLFSVEWYAGVPEMTAILLVYIANIMEYIMSCGEILLSIRLLTSAESLCPFNPYNLALHYSYFSW